MTGPEKLEYIRMQIVEIQSGLLTFIRCPYCGAENTPCDEKLCCELFAEASSVVLDRMEKQAAVDFICQVRDRVS